MIELSPALLVAAANAFVGLGGEKVSGGSGSPVVELFLREVRQPATAPWCAAFVHHVGYWSHYDTGSRTSSWPLPATASCWELGEYGRRRGVLVDEPAVGDVFLVYSKALRRFAHTGIVTDIGSTPALAMDIGSRASTLITNVGSRASALAAKALPVCTTVEGNAVVAGMPPRHTTRRKLRRFSAAVGDRFIRWTLLDAVEAQAA